MYEQMVQFLTKQYNMVIKADTHADKKTLADQAFGGLSFAIQMCGDDWDGADRYIDLWTKVWYAKFTKAVYNYDVEV